MINCVFGHGLHVLYGMLIDLRYDLGNSPLISVLADICLRRYIEKTCQGDGQTSTRQIAGEVAGEVQKFLKILHTPMSSS